MTTDFVDIVEMTDEQKALHACGQLAIGQVLGLRSRDVRKFREDKGADLAKVGLSFDDFNEALEEGDASWRSQLSVVAGASPASPVRDALAIDLCLSSPFMSVEGLAISPSVRRADAVLDILDVDFCATDAHMSLSQSLLDLEPLGGDKFNSETFKKWKGHASTAAQGIMWFHPILGAAATAGLGMIGSAESVPEPSSDDPAVDLMVAYGKLLVICRFGLEGESTRRAAKVVTDELKSQVASVGEDLRAHGRLATSGAVGNTFKNAERRHAVLISALTSFSALAGDLDALQADEVKPPSVVGMALPAARRTLSALGFSVDVVDGIKPGGTARAVWSENNWFVRETTRTGRAITLHVAKGTDPH